VNKIVVYPALTTVVGIELIKKWVWVVVGGTSSGYSGLEGDVQGASEHAGEQDPMRGKGRWCWQAQAHECWLNLRLFKTNFCCSKEDFSYSEFDRKLLFWRRE